MVKIRYIHNNEVIEKDVYEAALTLLSLRKGDRVFGPLEPPLEPTRRSTRYKRRGTLTASPEEDVANVVQQSSTNIVEEPPPDDQPRNNNEEVVEEAGAAGGEAAAMPAVPAIMNLIGACSPPFVKQLTKSDVTDGQGRLTIKKEFVILNLAPMFNGNEDLIEGIEVTVFNGGGREYDMTFKLWASKLYVLMKGWKEFYKTNDLTEAGEYVTLWMFRHVDTQKLCFAIIQGQGRIEGP